MLHSHLSVYVRVPVNVCECLWGWEGLKGFALFHHTCTVMPGWQQLRFDKSSGNCGHAAWVQTPWHTWELGSSCREIPYNISNLQMSFNFSPLELLCVDPCANVWVSAWVCVLVSVCYCVPLEIIVCLLRWVGYSGVWVRLCIRGCSWAYTHSCVHHCLHTFWV